MSNKSVDVEAVDVDLVAGMFEASLFLPSENEYELKQHTIGNFELTLYSHPAASTDYDLTGIIVWPVSKLLSFYLVHKQQCLKDMFVLELGSGCGLPGLVASSLQNCNGFGERKNQTHGRVVLTDCEEEVLKVLSKNVKHQISLIPETTSFLTSEYLLWGNETEQIFEAAAFREKYTKVPDIFIAADVFHPSFGSPKQVFDTILLMSSSTEKLKNMLRTKHDEETLPLEKKVEEKRKDIELWVGFVDRGNMTEVLEASVVAGFAHKIVILDEFVPEEFMKEVLSFSDRILMIVVFTKTVYE
mmetsp:Transcript_10003/g.12971  ORF Transcript_10003/g.12971 Transcript_10003/m.12971 type:complete len:301 (-) Transcript_10003:245-1147(-)